MKVLVTGGAGYIGSHVVRHLARLRHDVVVLDNLSSGHEWAVLHGRLEKVDLADRAAVDNLFREESFDAVIHFAAHIEVEESLENPGRYYDNNTANALGLWRLCAAHGTRNIVFSSTAAVYGMPKKSPVDESAQLAPINPYGASKMMSERMLMDLAEGGSPRFAILRYFNVAGAEPQARIGEAHEPETHIIPRCLQAALNNEPIHIYGTDYPTPDGTCIRDYIHVEDLASAHVAALDYLDRGGESVVLNCGYGRGYSVWEIIAAVRTVTGIDLQVVEEDRRRGDPAELVANVDRMNELLAWQPEFDDIETIVRHAWQWEKKRHLK